jgi:diaminohydroxyphosphoribosylaminopyrimidine deaminase / 5-amino-6-(5-phosphoribosylamino)uracil reductase
MVESRRPLVTWKFGACLDERLAAADGTSQWITSQEARTDAHRLRVESDAVMVGSGTQQADDPHLAVRHVEASRQPLRLIARPLPQPARVPPTP